MTSIAARTVRIDQHGGPEQLQWVYTTVGDPGPGEIRIRHHAVGLNYIDVYQRSGLYPMAMPLQLGMEGAGVVEAVGPGCDPPAVGRPRCLRQHAPWQLLRRAHHARPMRMQAARYRGL
jgi:NADPH2:quinone reductase